MTRGRAQPAPSPSSVKATYHAARAVARLGGWAAESVRGSIRDFAQTLVHETSVSLGKAYGRAQTLGRAEVKVARWVAPRAYTTGKAAAATAKSWIEAQAPVVKERLRSYLASRREST